MNAVNSVFNYRYFVGKDQGVNIRHKVSDMIEFIQDDDRLRDERKKAKKNKDKYVGMSSDSMGFRGGFDSSWQDKWPSSGNFDISTLNYIVNAHLYCTL